MKKSVFFLVWLLIGALLAWPARADSGMDELDSLESEVDALGEQGRVVEMTAEPLERIANSVNVSRGGMVPGGMTATQIQLQGRIRSRGLKTSKAVVNAEKEKAAVMAPAADEAVAPTPEKPEPKKKSPKPPKAQKPKRHQKSQKPVKTRKPKKPERHYVKGVSIRQVEVKPPVSLNDLIKSVDSWAALTFRQKVEITDEMIDKIQMRQKVRIRMPSSYYVNQVNALLEANPGIHHGLQVLLVYLAKQAKDYRPIVAVR